MTAVAAVKTRNHPLLIGDLLLSGPEDPQRTFRSPTIGPITRIFPEGSSFVPVAMRQKLSIFGETLAVGWAGDATSARSLLKDLAAAHHSNALTPATLATFINNADKDQKDGVQLVGWLLDSGTAHRFHMNATVHDDSDAGCLVAIGSGAQRLADHLKATNFPKMDGGRTLNKAEYATGFALASVGSLISLELSDAQTLFQYFGGGFEVATALEGRFVKLTNITHIFWLIEQGNTDAWRAKLHKVAKYDYQSDVLVIRTADSEPTLPDGRLAFELRTFVIEPAHYSITSEASSQLSLPSFNSQWLCHYFIPMSHAARRKPGIFTSVSWNPDPEKSIVKFLEGDQGRFDSFTVNEEEFRKIIGTMERTRRQQ
jgi:hypothetical protein